MVPYTRQGAVQTVEVAPLGCTHGIGGGARTRRDEQPGRSDDLVARIVVRHIAVRVGPVPRVAAHHQAAASGEPTGDLQVIRIRVPVPELGDEAVEIDEVRRLSVVDHGIALVQQGVLPAVERRLQADGLPLSIAYPVERVEREIRTIVPSAPRHHRLMPVSCHSPPFRVPCRHDRTAIPVDTDRERPLSDRKDEARPRSSVIDGSHRAFRRFGVVDGEVVDGEGEVGLMAASAVVGIDGVHCPRVT